MTILAVTDLLDLALQMQQPSWDRYSLGLNELILGPASHQASGIGGKINISSYHHESSLIVTA